MEYRTFEVLLVPRGGLMGAISGSPPGTVNYLLVDSVGHACANIPAHGRTVVMPKQEVPNVGWFALFLSPGGVVQAVFEPKQAP
jgi:predicted enzyme related to lactoylglutathione lyase